MQVTVSWLCLLPVTEQEVLLSLVTHLAHQLPYVDTEVKLTWLLQTAPALDPKHPGVAGHCRYSIRQLVHAI
jgi:hypothetical protein